MSNEKKQSELEEMEAANGEFGENESSEGLLNDEAASEAVGGITYTRSPRGSTPNQTPPQTR
jgi:hypothetical protein